MKKMKKMFSFWDELIVNFQEDVKNEEHTFFLRWKHCQLEDEKNEKNAFLLRPGCPLQDEKNEENDLL